MATVNQLPTVACPPANHITVISRRCALYRVYDTNNLLLYVGISTQPRRRFTQHRAEKTWWPQVARYTTEWFDNTDLAAAAEREAIRAEKPRHNLLRYGSAPSHRSDGFKLRPSWSACRSQNVPYAFVWPFNDHSCHVEVELDTTKVDKGAEDAPYNLWEDVDPDGILGLVLRSAAIRSHILVDEQMVFGSIFVATGSHAFISCCQRQDADPVADAFVDWWAGGTLALDLLDEWTA